MERYFTGLGKSSWYDLQKIQGETFHCKTFIQVFPQTHLITWLAAHCTGAWFLSSCVAASPWTSIGPPVPIIPIIPIITHDPWPLGGIPCERVRSMWIFDMRWEENVEHTIWRRWMGGCISILHICPEEEVTTTILLRFGTGVELTTCKWEDLA